MSNNNVLIWRRANLEGVNRELKSQSADIYEHGCNKRRKTSPFFFLQPTAFKPQYEANIVPPHWIIAAVVHTLSAIFIQL